MGECFFLVPAHLGSPGQRAIKWLCMCVHVINISHMPNIKYICRQKLDNNFDEPPVNLSKRQLRWSGLFVCESHGYRTVSVAVVKIGRLVLPLLTSKLQRADQKLQKTNCTEVFAQMVTIIETCTQVGYLVQNSAQQLNWQTK